MLSVLLTGSSGFIGKNLLPPLRERYAVTAPPRKELDLRDADAVRRFVGKGRFDAVIHAANPTGHNPLDPADRLFEDSMRVFLALESCADSYGKLIYFGSGAEFGKHRPLDMVVEEDFGLELPRDAYGLSRYLMQKLAVKSGKIVNLRLFGCYGPGDAPHKLIPDVIRNIREGGPISLRQNVLFDFLYVTDLVPVIEHCLKSDAVYADYNVCSGSPVTILSLAEAVRRRLRGDAPIVIKREGMGLAYTASNARLRAELPGWRPTRLETGIDNIVNSELRG